MAETDPQHQEMSFFDHLGDLRSRLMKAFIGVAVGCVATGIFVETLMNDVLLRPATQAGIELQNLKLFGKPMLYLKVIFFSGLIISFPWVLWNLWKFVAPGLYQNERKWARRITFMTSICFLTGVVFGYYILLPGMMAFSFSFGTSAIKNLIDANEYFSDVTTALLGAGVIFELPMLTYVLSSIGILSPQLMLKYWRHAVVIILIIAAILTPSPDPYNQIIFAIPLYILYGISIIVSIFTYKKPKNAEPS